MHFNSDKVCDVRYGRIQGIEDLIEHFKDSSVMNQQVAFANRGCKSETIHRQQVRPLCHLKPQSCILQLILSMNHFVDPSPHRRLFIKFLIIIMDESLSREDVLALFEGVEPLEEGTKELTFVQDCHQPQ